MSSFGNCSDVGVRSNFDTSSLFFTSINGKVFKNISQIVNNLMLSTLLNIVKNLSIEQLTSLFPDCAHPINEFVNTVALRNQRMHSKFMLGITDGKVVFSDYLNSFKSMLPIEYLKSDSNHTGLIKEMEKCNINTNGETLLDNSVITLTVFHV